MKRIRVRAAVLLHQADSVLLVRHQKGARTYWLLPGGGVNYGETAPEAARREVAEETGLDVEVADLLMASETIAPDGSRHVLHLVFKASLRGGALKVGNEERLAEVRFVPLAELPALEFHPPIAEIVGELARGRTPDQRYLGRLWRA
ncbi:MAG: NUDIX domain-containing protein [Candidatus Xenobium sp.]|jgi:8-oxo-dGTP diphosphatase|nr:NUDIX hydrolase [Burkholderiales bacterium]